jgi:hypothetical protein
MAMLWFTLDVAFRGSEKGISHFFDRQARHAANTLNQARVNVTWKLPYPFQEVQPHDIQP